jgi:FkbM family methyltransferase
MGRKLAFVLASSEHGTMIVNRFDYRMINDNEGFGVGFQILNAAQFDPEEVKMALQLLHLRRNHHGDGMIAIDGGANIGVHTVEWAKAMTGWGSVLAIEAQERIYYALAGNVAINNCFNATAINAAISSEPGTLQIPQPNYFLPSSFGSLELRQRDGNEFIGQAIDYSKNTVTVRKISIDEINLPRVDFIKLDIEGMEMEALEGARQTIDRCMPILLIERIKADATQLTQWMEARGYQVMQAGINLVCVHKDDKTLTNIVVK